MASDGISICIAAYKTKDCIKRTLDSIYKQTWFVDHDNYEVIVGVDGDNELVVYLQEIMGMYKNIRVLSMCSNKGTYITSNTVINEAKYANIIRFDSDDIMYSNMVSVLMDNYSSHDFVMFKRVAANKLAMHSHGCVFFKKAIFEKFGGYRPWPCAADTEWFERVKNFVDLKKIDESLFEYVYRPTSLTHGGATKFGGSLREQYRNKVASGKYTTEKSAIIECVTNTFVEVFPAVEHDSDEYISSLRATPLILKGSPIHGAPSSTNSSSYIRPYPLSRSRKSVSTWSPIF